MDSGSQTEDEGYLDGQLLIAMPAMGDPRFSRSVIYLCAHSSEGAMGIIINQRAPNISFSALTDCRDHATLLFRFEVRVG